MTHGRAQVQHVEMGLTRDGTITGVRAKVFQDGGAYPAIGAFLPFLTRTMAQGVYAIPKVEFNAVERGHQHHADRARTAAPGRPEATAMLERIIDIAADELGIDPVEIRKQNFIPPEAFPLTTVTGANYDVGEYAQGARRGVPRSPATTSCAPSRRRRRERGDVDAARHRRVRLRRGRPPAGSSRSTARSRSTRTARSPRRSARRPRPGPRDRVLDDRAGAARHPDGAGARSCSRTPALVPRGHGHDGIALAADRRERAVPGERGGAREGAARSPRTCSRRTSTTSCSRTTAASASPACRPLRVGVGRAGRGREGPGPTRPRAWSPALAHALDFNQGEADVPVRRARRGRRGRHRDRPRRATSATSRSTTAVASSTRCSSRASSTAASRRVRRRRSGRRVTLRRGRQPAHRATSWTTRCRARRSCRASRRRNTETPTPLNPLGAKGIGESGTIGSTPAVHNAVIDALAHLGVRHIDMPLTARAGVAAADREAPARHERRP